MFKNKVAKSGWRKLSGFTKGDAVAVVAESAEGRKLQMKNCRNEVTQ